MANIQSILITNGIGLVLLAGLYVTSHMSRERQRIDDRMLTFMIFVCAGCCIMEPMEWLVDGRPGTIPNLLNWVGNFYCFLATNIYAYLWVLYVDLRLTRAERITHWYPGLIVPTTLLSILILTDRFHGLMFTIDASNVYARQPLSYANYVMTFTSLFYSVHVRSRIQHEQGPVRFFPIWMFMVPVIVGALIQALMFGVSLAWTGIAVGLVLIYMSQQNELSYLDSLTGLYNRTYFDYVVQQLRRSGRRHVGGLMIDMDFFKAINDTHGHDAGDEALRRVANLLQECAPARATTIRFAGDEFIMLLEGARDAEVAQVEQGIRAKVDDVNAAGELPYVLSLSIGQSTFDPSADTVDAFLQRIDKRMYEEKRAKHAGR